MQVTVRRWTALAVSTSTLSGLAYGYTRYFGGTADEWGESRFHPWSGFLQHSHVLLVPLFVLMLGALWVTHIWPYYRAQQPRRRLSGLSNWALAVLMVISGYAVQVAVEDQLRLAAAWCHGVSSTLWLVTFLWHRYIAR